MKRMLLIALICACGFVAVKDGRTQNVQPSGPIRLEDARPSIRPLGPVYTLRCLQVSGTRPIDYVWLLQKETAPSQGFIEPNETVFRSLDSPVLRNFVSHLPSGTRIVHSPMMLPGPDPTMKIGSENEPGLKDFINFCQSKKVDFIFGVAF